jgi:GTPase SAR1 family protein
MSKENMLFVNVQLKNNHVKTSFDSEAAANEFFSLRKKYQDFFIQIHENQWIQKEESTNHFISQMTATAYDDFHTIFNKLKKPYYNLRQANGSNPHPIKLIFDTNEEAEIFLEYLNKIKFEPITNEEFPNGIKETDDNCYMMSVSKIKFKLYIVLEKYFLDQPSLEALQKHNEFCENIYQQFIENNSSVLFCADISDRILVRTINEIIQNTDLSSEDKIHQLIGQIDSFGKSLLLEEDVLLEKSKQLIEAVYHLKFDYNQCNLPVFIDPTKPEFISSKFYQRFGLFSKQIVLPELPSLREQQRLNIHLRLN